ncbi:accessory gene regulator B [Paenibacillus algorifonticola]|uniref:Accessory gene regulator B n=1 Tax=Paenibacillus algorifonticola TaxID=684063 RepID=A0A1I2H1M5_9BACL|nr:accessory gene regulator B family protein [Paenibacillus algorifonticola]SFF23438.1 accessory gene regulator B [Paenibacillus algorifonticola]
MMIEYISKKIALSIKRADPQGDVSVNVMAYQLGYWINPALIAAVTLSMGWATGAFLMTLMGMVAFCILRHFTGGVHLSLTKCFVVSTALLSIIPHIVLNDVTVIVLTLLSMFVLLIYQRGSGAPLLLILSNIFLQSDVIALAFLAQMALVAIKHQDGGARE